MIRTIGSFALAAAVAVLIAASAQAQPQGGPRGGGFGGGMMGGPSLINMKSVQDELKLDSDQLEKAKKIVQEQAEKVRDQITGLRDLKPEERMEKIESIMAPVRRDTYKALSDAKVLKEDQTRRLHQIDLQVRAPQSMTSEWIANRLKLTDDQKTKIKAVITAQREEMRSAMQSAGSDRSQMFEKMRDMRKATIAKAVAVLNDEQKKQWDEMTGKAFELTFNRPQQ